MRSLWNEGDRAEIMRRIGGLRPDSHRQWGTMTPNEAVCHLTDGFVTMLGDRPAKDGSTLFTRTLLRFFAMTVPMSWPKGVATMPEVDQRVGGTPPEAFAADLARLESAVDDFVARLDERTMGHPIFGRMSRAEWGRWAYRHLDHHARQFGV